MRICVTRWCSRDVEVKFARLCDADQVSDQLSTGKPEAPDSFNPAAAEHEQENLKRDMLLGHLLTLAVQVRLLTEQLLCQTCLSTVPSRDTASYVYCCKPSCCDYRHLIAGLWRREQSQEHLPADAMPSIAAHLREQALLPKWVERLLLMSDGALFDHAFQRMFAQVQQWLEPVDLQYPRGK